MKAVKIKKKRQEIQCNRKQEPNICEAINVIFTYIYRMSVTGWGTERDENNYIMKTRRASRDLNLDEILIIILCGHLTTSNIWLDFFCSDKHTKIVLNLQY